MTSATMESLEDQYPAVEAAYSYVLPSYQLLVSRLDAADTRLSALLTLVSSLTLGAPLFARSLRPDVSFESPLFLLGLALFIVGAVAGVIGRVRGAIQLPNPRIFYEESLHYSPWEFKKNALYFAGEAFAANSDVVRVKGNIAFGVTIAWLLEVVCLVTWLTFA